MTLLSTKKKKRKLTPFGRFLKITYRTVMTLSVLIVAGYLAWNVAVPPPAVAVPTSPPAPTVAQPGTSGAPTVQRTRKPLFYTFLLTAKDQVSANTDTIIVASYDVTAQKAGLVSVPRDTLVDRRVGKYHYYKINAAYANGGLPELKAAVSDVLGIPIDFHIMVDVDSFVKIVDAAGGVDFEVPVPMDYDDPTQDLHIHYEPRLYTGLSGSQVLEIARCRKNTVWTGDTYTLSDAYPDAEIGRTRTQQALLKAMAKKLVSWNSVPKLTTFVGIFNESVETDLALNDMLFFATSAMKLDLSTALTSVTLPGDGSAVYRGHTYCYAYDAPACLDIVNTLLNPYTTPVTADMVTMLRGN